MKIKYKTFHKFLSKGNNADVELILKAKKLANGNFAITTSYELSEKQLSSMGLTLPKKDEGETVSRDSKAPKWFTEWTTAFSEKIDHRFDSIEKRIESIDQRLTRIENTPTMKRELSEDK